MTFTLIASGDVEAAEPAPEAKRCVAIHSVNFKSGRMQKVSFKYRWCDADRRDCDGALSNYTLANEGSAFRIAILCYTSAAQKKVRIVFDGSFDEGFQLRSYSLKPARFELNQFRRFRLPNTHCIVDGAYHFDLASNGIQLYSGRPSDLAKGKCQWNPVSDAAYQRCVWSGTSYSGKLTHCSDAISQEQDAKRIARSHAQRGEAYRKKQQFDRAIADFDSALELDPKYAWAMGSRGQTYRQKGEFDRAIVDLTKAIELDPKLNWVLANRGEAYRRKGEFDKAIADLTKAIQRDPKYSWAIANLAETYRQKGAFDKAIAAFDKALKIRPDYAWALGSRGQAYRQKGEFDKAVADLNRAIDLSPAMNWVVANRGEVYRQLGEFDKAIADFDNALARAPKYTWVLVRRGVAHRQKGAFAEAIADLDKALELDPDSSWALANLGEAYRLTDDGKQAIAAFDKAIAKDNKYVWALVRRGATYRQLGRFEQALKSFDRAVELSPRSAWPLAWRGRAKFFVGQFPAAAADLEQANKLTPSPYATLFHYLALKNTGSADADAVLGKETSGLDDGSWPHLIARLFLGKADKQALMEAATDPTKRCEANYYVGEWLALRNERQQALENFKKAAETCPKDYIEYAGATAALKRLNP